MWNNEKCGVSADLLAWERKQSIMLDEYDSLIDKIKDDLKAVKGQLWYLKNNYLYDDITEDEIIDFLIG